MARVLLAAALAVLAACPAADDDTDHAWACPDLDGSLFALGTDLGDTRYHDAPSSMVPGSTQLITIGRYRDTTVGADFSERFDAELLGARGIDLVRVSHNQFLLRAHEEGSACVRLSDPANPDDAHAIPLYAMHPLRYAIRPTPYIGAHQDFVYARGARATLEMWSGGGWRIVDSGLRYLHGDGVSTPAWDQLQLTRVGRIPIDVVTSDGITESLEVEVVAAPDEVVVTSPAEVPAALLAGHTQLLCVWGKHRGRVVAGLDFTFEVTNANWTTDNGLGRSIDGCVRVTPTVAGQRVEITATTHGVATTLAFDVH